MPDNDNGARINTEKRKLIVNDGHRARKNRKFIIIERSLDIKFRILVRQLKSKIILTILLANMLIKMEKLLMLKVITKLYMLL